VNTFFGEGETLDDIKHAASAGLNIVVSGVHGVESAKRFEEVHGVPYIVTGLPIGAIASERFLREAGEAAGADKSLTEKVILEEKANYYSYLERITDIYNDIDLQRYAVVVSDATYAPALTRFLSDELGWLPELAVVTDSLDEEAKKAAAAGFENLNSKLKVNVRFDSDASSVKKYLREAWPRNRNQKYYDSFGPAVILGSSYERDLAAEFGWPLAAVSFPLTGRCVMNRAYAGFNGALSLTEDVITFLVAGR